MHPPKILVTGATGKTGAAVVAQLREKDWPVRAVVHRRDARSERLERLGVETVIAEPYDPDQLLDAMQGISRAYFLPFFHPYMIQGATAFALAAREAKLEAIVQMSQWLSSPAHPSLATRQTWLVDRLFAMLPGIAHTIINPGFFADNFLRFIDFAALLGIYPVMTGRSQSAPVSNEDIARVVTAALTNPDLHAGKRYRPTGPKLLSAYDVAAILEKALGSPVRPVETPLWLLLKAARLQRVSAFEMSGYRHYVEEHRRGTFARDGGTSDVVREVTGRPAEDFEVTARRYAALPKANRTAGNRARAFANFMRTPMSPGYDLDRFERELLFPVPPMRRLAIDDERWQAEHDLQSAQRPIAPRREAAEVA